eukprot:1160915-Pelagomonas_calceolata.AAC.12
MQLIARTTARTSDAADYSNQSMHCVMAPCAAAHVHPGKQCVTRLFWGSTASIIKHVSKTKTFATWIAHASSAHHQSWTSCSSEVFNEKFHKQLLRTVRDQELDMRRKCLHHLFTCATAKWGPWRGAGCRGESSRSLNLPHNVKLVVWFLVPYAQLQSEIRGEVQAAERRADEAHAEIESIRDSCEQVGQALGLDDYRL